MGLINRNTDYAVRALCYISRRGEVVVPVTELVKALKIPRPFLRKILQDLNKSGILESHKGKGGGFRLNVPAGRIFLTDLIEVFQGEVRINECIFKKNVCPDRKVCPLRKKVSLIEGRLLGELKKITIGSLAKEGACHG